MNGAPRILTIAGFTVAGIFVLWAVSVCVYLLGGVMKKVSEDYELRVDNASIMRWGAAYSVAALVVLFLLVRFVKFAWEY